MVVDPVLVLVNRLDGCHHGLRQRIFVDSIQRYALKEIHRNVGGIDYTFFIGCTVTSGSGCVLV